MFHGPLPALEGTRSSGVCSGRDAAARAAKTICRSGGLSPHHERRTQSAPQCQGWLLDQAVEQLGAQQRCRYTDEEEQRQRKHAKLEVDEPEQDEHVRQV